MARRLLLWAQNELLSLTAVHVPGSLNLGADMLSRGNVALWEWTLHPQMVLKIWSVLGEAEVNLFASEDNSHCPTYFSIQRDALAHDWPSAHQYAFPPITLLVAPLWRNQARFPELVQLSALTFSHR